MSEAELKGVVVPVITPVNDRDDVDEPAFRKVLRRLIEAGVNAIFVGGSAGEGPLLRREAWRRMVETACDEVAGRVSLLGGVSDTSTARVVEKIEVLRAVGFRRYVVTPTFYLALKTPQEQIRLFGRARDAGGDMEMIAYNIPQCVGSVLPVETVCDMARRGWIRCCKESSGDLAYLKRLIAEGAELGLGVLVGDEPAIAEGLLAGARGIVPVCANYDPALFLRAVQAAAEGNRSELREIQQRILFVRDRLVIAGPCWLAGIKYSLSVLGLGSGRPVSPLEPAPEEQRRQIDELIRQDLAKT